MTPEKAFLQAVLDKPDDDAPRLIYADWLEEHGDGPRAEFIRLQCQLARRDEFDPDWRALNARAFSLLDAYSEWWQPEIPRKVREDRLSFRRGFFSVLCQKVEDWLDRPDRYCHASP